MASRFCVAGDLGPTPDTPIDYKNQLDSAITLLASTSSVERQAGRIQIALLPPAAFGLLEAAVGREDVSPAVSQPLHTLFNQQKNWQKGRIAHDGREQAAGDWYEKLAIESYEKLGRRDAKWDQLVADAFHAGFHRNDRTDVPRIRRALDAALAAGCDDPLVYAIAAYNYESAGETTDRLFDLYAKAQAGLKERGYPSALQLFNTIHYRQFRRYIDGSSPKPHANDALITALQKEEVELFPELLKLHPPVLVLRRAATPIIFVAGHNGDEDAYQKVTNALLRQNWNDPLVKELRATYVNERVWRGPNSPKPGDPMTRKFQDQLQEVETALILAWTPTADSSIAAMYVEVGKGRGYPYMNAEIWAVRTTEADPTDGFGWFNMMEYCRPSWIGSAELSRDLGDRVFAATNWQSGTPFIKALRHDGLAADSHHASSYYRQPEVWPEVNSVYEPYMVAEPGDIVTRAQYCAFACRCGQWEIARKQFELMGDHVPVRAFKNPELLKRWRDRATTAPAKAE